MDHTGVGLETGGTPSLDSRLGPETGGTARWSLTPSTVTVTLHQTGVGLGIDRGAGGGGGTVLSVAWDGAGDPEGRWDSALAGGKGRRG